MKKTNYNTIKLENPSQGRKPLKPDPNKKEKDKEKHDDEDIPEYEPPMKEPDQDDRKIEEPGKDKDTVFTR